jgi:hypothetical protein
MEKFHLTKIGDHWHLTKEGAVDPARIFPTKEIAEEGSADYLRDRAASLKIHGIDGIIEEERTYPRSADLSETQG